MTTAQDEFDTEGNFTNPLLSYYLCKSTGRDTHVGQATEQQVDYDAVLHGHDVQLGQEASNLEDVFSEKSVNSSSTPDVAKNEVRRPGRF